MTLRTLIVLVMSLVCGTSAAVGVNRFLTNSEQKPAVVQTTPIVVAAVNVPRGSVLGPEVLTTQAWPDQLIPQGALRDMDQAVEMATLTPLVAGEPLLETKISDSGSGAAALVKPGMRAYTIETPTTSSGVGGFVLPGHHVDVILTVSSREVSDIIGEGTGGGGAWTLLQNVEILAADSRLDQNSEKKKDGLRSVTLLVTPDMAAKLTLAQKMGTLNLTLRNDTDESIAETSPVTMRDLVFLQQALTKQEQEEAEAERAELVAAVSGVEDGRDHGPEILTYRGHTTGLIRVLRPEYRTIRAERN